MAQLVHVMNVLAKVLYLLYFYLCDIGELDRLAHKTLKDWVGRLFSSETGKIVCFFAESLKGVVDAF